MEVYIIAELVLVVLSICYLLLKVLLLFIDRDRRKKR